VEEIGRDLKELPPESNLLQTAIENHNSSVATTAFVAILLARFIIFHAFLLSAQQQPGGITESTKRAWLLLQLSPNMFLTSDRFYTLSTQLKDNFSDTQLRGMAISELDSVQRIVGKKTHLFIALDEAQGLAYRYKKCFLSHAEPVARSGTTSLPRSPRPIIRKLVEVWSLLIRDIIISGTGLSMKLVEEALKSVVAKKDARTDTFIDLGAFESDVNQLHYVQLYLPPHFLTTESGTRLASRIAFWLHGRFVRKTCIYKFNADLSVRHRFTAAYVTALIQNCFESPHRVLDDFIHIMTKFRPTDADDIVEKGLKCAGASMSLAAQKTIMAFDFPGLRAGTECPTSCGRSF
jgi:hypothetical protein